MNRPVVALTAASASIQWSIWGEVEACLLPVTYQEKVARAGGAPLLLPPIADAVRPIMERVDALLMTGGEDVDPALYGEEAGKFTRAPDKVREAAELAALAVAEERGIPVLGICRGLQLISVVRGGTLDQHLPEHSPRVPGKYDARSVRVEPGSVLGSTLGASATVYCHHHQGIDKLGSGLVATAWSADGVIEGAEAKDPAAPFLVGLQAHGELGEDTVPLFEAFIEAARRGPRRGGAPRG
ncbi:gamma-glutamyl-gamma-aminobutyrate hydrolase family protein [Streptomyces sp. NPDC060028]|uniref:gamma-glutamyl-gamma-aminobutyrate hydrolase family protein n=1 Tax=Streptomyces sp. NPDC060028 TaxID=3347041 RepID=UPI0036BBCC14